MTDIPYLGAFFFSQYPSVALTRNCSNSNCKRSKSLIVELLFIYIIYI